MYLRDLLGQEELIRGKFENVLGVADRIVADALSSLSVSSMRSGDDGCEYDGNTVRDVQSSFILKQ